MHIDKHDTAVVVIDPQHEVLDASGLAWPLVRESLQDNQTIEHMERLFKAAKAPGVEVCISPHSCYPPDTGWQVNGPLETAEATAGMFARPGSFTLEGRDGSGADWLARCKPYIQAGNTIGVAPHRVFGPDTNDLVRQLHQRRLSTLRLGGMRANRCVALHWRALREHGFDVAVAKDATAAPKHPAWGDGSAAALITYAFLADAVWTTEDTVKAMARGQRSWRPDEAETCRGISQSRAKT